MSRFSDVSDYRSDWENTETPHYTLTELSDDNKLWLSDCLTSCFSRNWISSPPLQLPQQLSGIKSPSLWIQQQDERYDWQAAIWKQVRRVHLPPNWLFIIKALLEVWLLTSLLPPLQSAAASLLTIKKTQRQIWIFMLQSCQQTLMLETTGHLNRYFGVKGWVW